MNVTQTSRANEWNHHHAYHVHRQSDSEEYPTDGVNSRLSPASNRDGGGQLQDRATRLLMEKAAGTRRKV